jgi:site-specific recombinase XerD
MRFAAKAALRLLYLGHFGTVAQHLKRGEKFIEALEELSINDFRNVKLEHVIQYSRQIECLVSSNKISTSYGHNLLSSMNILLFAVRGNAALRVRPSDYLPKRRSVRTIAPKRIEITDIQKIIEKLCARRRERVAATLGLTYTLGLRVKEAALLNNRTALDEACRTGFVTITAGTKGGRGKYVERRIPVDQYGIAALELAVSAQENYNNLIGPYNKYITFYTVFHAHSSKLLSEMAIKDARELRAAYACRRYNTLTGHLAPCVLGFRQASPESDKCARETIAQELGHGRIYVLVSYVGRQ